MNFLTIASFLVLVVVVMCEDSLDKCDATQKCLDDAAKKCWSRFHAASTGHVLLNHQYGVPNIVDLVSLQDFLDIVDEEQLEDEGAISYADVLVCQCMRELGHDSRNYCCNWRPTEKVDIKRATKNDKCWMEGLVGCMNTHASSISTQIRKDLHHCVTRWRGGAIPLTVGQYEREQGRRMGQKILARTWMKGQSELTRLITETVRARQPAQDNHDQMTS